MKIVSAQIDVMEFEIPRFSVNDARNSVGGQIAGGLLRLFTDEGVQGNAHLGDRGGGGSEVIRNLWDQFGRRLVGLVTDQREAYWEQLETDSPKNVATQSLWSYIDVALWDATAKLVGEPVHRLLGTNRETCDVYATYPPLNSTVVGYVREAERLMESGFKAYKIHPGEMSTNEVINMVKQVRQAVGPDVDLMLDPNHGYDFDTALKIGEALDSCEFRWFEDPVPWSDQSAIGKLSELLETPLAMSDSPEFTTAEAHRSLEMGWPEIVRGTTRKIGITGLKRQSDAAADFGRQCEVGTAGNSLMNAANLNVIMSVPNCRYYEYWMPLEAQWFGMLPEIKVDKDGKLEAPTKPGLGFGVDEDFVSRNLVATLKT